MHTNTLETPGLGTALLKLWGQIWVVWKRTVRFFAPCARGCHRSPGISWQGAAGHWVVCRRQRFGAVGQARGLFALSPHWSIWRQTATQPGATRIAPASGWCPFHPQEHPSSPGNSTGNNPVNLVFTDRFIALEKICKESGFLSGVQKAALRGHVRDEQREPTWLKLKKKE